MIVDPATPLRDLADNGGETVYLSRAGGLTQFGAYLDTLMPGGWSSQRHWHSAEDEFLYLLSGMLTLCDDGGETEILPGDAICWRHGDPNAHHLTNRGVDPARFLILGSRCKGDICTYPDQAERQVNRDSTWQIVTDAGEVIEGGDLPAHLLNLRDPWGTPWDGTPRPSVIRAGSVPGVSDPGSAAEFFADLGTYVAHPLSDVGGLTQFGAFTETLLPGARSGQRHWHAEEDEFLYTLDGTVTLHENSGATDLPPGTCVCWPAGVSNAHCLENRTAAPVTYFVAGSRLPEDEVTYPDIDLLYPGWPRRVEP